MEIPRQRNTREENKIIKEESGDDPWNDRPNKKRHKDIDVCWVKKNGDTFYGYKNHIKVDAKSKIIGTYYASDASVHDSQALELLLTEKDKGQTLHADSAYTGPHQEATISEHKMINNVHEKGRINKPIRSGELSAIYIPDPSTLEDRSLVRMRATLIKDMTKFKQRIKSFLYFYGIAYPKEFERSGSHWSKRFMKWLNEEVSLQHDSDIHTLKILVQEAEQQRKLLLEVLHKIHSLASGEKYAKNIASLRTIPGIEFITAMTFLTEIEKIDRFENTDHFAGFVGMIPNRHSSGEKDKNGEMTFRGQDTLRRSLIESSWVAVRFDPALMMSYL